MSLFSSKAGRPRRIRARTVVAAIALLAVIAILGTYLYVSSLAGRRLGVAIAEADRSDPGWRLADVWARRAAVPDGENSANQVLLTLRHMPTTWPPLPRPVDPSRANSTGAQLDLLSQTDDLPPNVRLSEPLAAEARDELRKVSVAVVEARKLAEMPRGRFDLAMPPNYFLMNVGHAQQARNVARLLHADATLRAHDGDIDGALDTCRAILNLGRAIGDEPILVSQLVRMAIQTVAINTAQRVLAQGEASEPALAKFQALLEDEANHSFVLVSLRGERAGIDDTMGKLADGDVSLTSLGPGATGGLPTNLPFGAAYYRYNHALILEQMNSAIEIARRPDSEHVAAFQRWEADFKPPDQFLPRVAGALSLLLTPGLVHVDRAYLRSRANVAAGLAMIAAERHRIAHGSLPGSIDRIDPRFADTLPGDPFVGGPLRFKTTDDRLVIYSLGLDQHDDGGKFDRRNRPNPGTDQGLTLWDPAHRRQPPKRELPENVFQTDRPGDETGAPR